MQSRTDVKILAREIIDREGGYVNDPDDPGGATKYGVTIHTMRRLGLDLDGDGQRHRQRCAAPKQRSGDRNFPETLLLRPAHCGIATNAACQRV